MPSLSLKITNAQLTKLREKNAGWMLRLAKAKCFKVLDQSLFFVWSTIIEIPVKPRLNGLKANRTPLQMAVTILTHVQQ